MRRCGRRTSTWNPTAGPSAPNRAPRWRRPRAPWPRPGRWRAATPGALWSWPTRLWPRPPGPTTRPWPRCTGGKGATTVTGIPTAVVTASPPMATRPTGRAPASTPVRSSSAESWAVCCAAAGGAATGAEVRAAVAVGAADAVRSEEVAAAAPAEGVPSGAVPGVVAAFDHLRLTTCGNPVVTVPTRNGRHRWRPKSNRREPAQDQTYRKDHHHGREAEHPGAYRPTDPGQHQRPPGPRRGPGEDAGPVDPGLHQQHRRGRAGHRPDHR